MIEEIISPLRSIGLQVQQMLQRLVDVEGGDESTGVELRIDDQLRKALFEPFGQQEEEERQVVLHLTDAALSEFRLPKAMVTQEDHDAILQVSFGLKKKVRGLNNNKHP